MASLRDYYLLTKPGIIRGNLLTGIAGFCLAAQGHIEFIKLVGFCAGLALIIAAACICNNYYDRELDAHMKRTKSRGLVTGTINAHNALLYAFVLLVVGSFCILRWVNLSTWLIGLLAFTSYVLIYTPLKRQTIHATAIGTLPGALPPVAGYIAVTNHFNSACVLLFGLLFFWQLPHFYAIGLYRQKEYAGAKVPILPVIYPIKRTVVIIRLLIGGFIVVVPGFVIAGYCSWLYLVPTLGVSIFWLANSWRPITSVNQWGKQVFLSSLVVIAVSCSAIILDSFIH